MVRIFFGIGMNETRSKGTDVHIDDSHIFFYHTTTRW